MLLRSIKQKEKKSKTISPFSNYQTTLPLNQFPFDIKPIEPSTYSLWVY